MANTKITQHVIADDAITTAMITDANITPAKLHGTLDLSSKTLTLPATAIPSASTATTQSASDNSTKLATTAYVTTAIANLNDSAPTALNTLNELAAALNDDASFSSTITTALGTKLPLAGGTMTGNIAHAGDFTLDVGGDLFLDADGAGIYLSDGGTSVGRFLLSSSDLTIGALVQDKDIKFAGNDGGSGITALTLDISEAGFATFNDGGVFGGTGALRIPQGTTAQRPSAATGQIRWNTSDGALEVYNGSAWTAVGTGSSNKILDTFTGDNSTTDFTLSVTPANEDALMVFIDGVYQEKGDYVLTNAVLALDTAPASGEKIAVHITTASVHDGTSATNQQFTATAGQTAFTLSADPKSENNTQVYINGVYQQKTDYTVSGTTLTFDTGLTVGDVVEVNSFTVTTLGNTDTVSEGSSNLYHTTARARSAISVSGSALSYNSSTGVITSAAGYTDSDVETYLNTSEIYTDATNNRLGIGTSSPGAILDIKKTSSGTTLLSRLWNYENSNSASNAEFRIASGNAATPILTLGTSDAIRYSISSDTSGNLLFKSTGSTERMKIASSGDVTMSSTGSLTIPKGTTAQRPSSPANGMVRYNTTEDYVEYYNGSSWLPTSQSGVVAAGGTESNVTISGVVYKVHTFTSSGTLTVSSGGEFEFLLIAAGGGGGCGTAGGGGAGGYRTNVSGQSSGGGASAEGTAELSAGSHTITIGAGGAGAVTNSSDATNGAVTSIGSIVQASGGGAGGEGNPSNTRRAGQPGGSGGGAWEYSGDSGGAGSGTSGQGYAGGASAATGGAGGGGAGGTAGAHSSNTQNYDGGPGVSNNINGTATSRAGGGGGGLAGQSSASDGGGAGANGSATGTSGTANTGGGGGGGWAYASGNGGSGGSGLVIIRYRI